MSEARLTVARPFGLKPTVQSHGWCETPAFAWRDDEGVFERRERIHGRLYTIEVRQAAADRGHVTLALNLRPAPSPSATERVTGRALEIVRRMLRLDEDLSDFYRLCRRTPRLKAVPRMGAGRILRGATLAEDVIKALCATNVQWRQAVRMMERLADAAGRGSWPTPAQVAALGEDLLRQQVRLGYRAPYLLACCERLAHPNAALRAVETDPELPGAEAFRILTGLPGIGPTSAAYLLTMLGHYDRMAIDSSTHEYVGRAYFAGRKPTRREIESLFEHHGRWRALAYWWEFWLDWQTK